MGYCLAIRLGRKKLLEKYIVIYKNQNTLPHIQLFTQQLTNHIDIIEENEQLIVLQTK